jgi:N-acetylglucosamine-6-phosphate deacetylase
MKILLENAHLISPDREIADAAVVLENGRISAVMTSGGNISEVDEIIDCEGRKLLPGFIDLHAHGADGRDISEGSLDAVRHIARRKLQEGVTTWLPTTLTLPQEDLLEIARQCATYMATPDACRVVGLHVEGPFINLRNVGAQNPTFVRPPDFSELMRLHEIANVCLVSLAPELPGALEFIARATERGIRTSAAHSSATEGEIAAAQAVGLTQLTHFGNAMSPLHHRDIGMVGMGLLDDSLKLEIIPDGLHLCADMLRLIFKLVSIDRLMLITDSMAASWIEKGEVKLGGLEVVVDQGKAVLKSNGALAGSTLRFNEGLKIAAEVTGVPLTQLVKTTSWNQAQALGLVGFGKIEPGFHADLVLLDDDFSVWKTFVGGTER